MACRAEQSVKVRVDSIADGNEKRAATWDALSYVSCPLNWVSPRFTLHVCIAAKDFKRAIPLRQYPQSPARILLDFYRMTGN